VKKKLKKTRISLFANDSIQMQVNQIKYKWAQILFENKVEDHDQKACKEKNTRNFQSIKNKIKKSL
jgi:hypothetical protein